jgi:hypothetical protein
MKFCAVDEKRTRAGDAFLRVHYSPQQAEYTKATGRRQTLTFDIFLNLLQRVAVRVHRDEDRNDLIFAVLFCCWFKRARETSSAPRGLKAVLSHQNRDACNYATSRTDGINDFTHLLELLRANVGAKCKAKVEQVPMPE